MTNFDSSKFNKKQKKKIKKSMGSKKNVTVKTSNGLYFMGFIGAAIYYISTATDFWIGVVGVLKAIVWPAFLVYEALAKLA
jgi:hypothetical protein